MVDAGDDELGLEPLDQAEAGQPDAVDRRPVRGVSNGSVAKVDFLHPQRPPGRDRARHRGAIAVWRDHRQLDGRQLHQRLAQRLESSGLDPVVVGQQHPQRG